MKLLLLCNTLPEKYENEFHLVHRKPESWIWDIYEKLKALTNFDIIYLFPSKTKISKKISNTTFVSFPEPNYSRYYKENVLFFKKILNETKPNIIHIFGTEMPHSLEMVDAAYIMNMENCLVVQLQGIISMCAKYYSCFLPEKIIKRKTTLRDIIKNDSIRKQMRLFERRGMFEKQTLTKAKNVIGRTKWDRACISFLNPNAKYFCCNENLRQSFYIKRWDYSKCQKHSIFISQSNYPLKGFHIALEAFAMVKKFFPDAHLYTTGDSPFQIGFKAVLRKNSYQHYIEKLITKYNIRDSVSFLGFLDETEMVSMYLRANTFVLCSSIENSPNSLGESMMLGVPSIASDVGGISSLFSHLNDGYLYPANDPYMLAFYICKCFHYGSDIELMCKNATKHASIIHDSVVNFNTLLDIYKSIAQGSTDNE